MPADSHTRLIVDCDTGVDDSLALLYLASRPDIELVAVGSVHGNITADMAAANTLHVLEIADRPDVPVALGAARPMAQEVETAEFVHGHDGLGGAAQPPKGQVTGESAVEQLVRLARAEPGELSLLAVGPFTNLGLALLVEPELPRLLRQVTVMGGAFDVPGNVTGRAEANIWHDPEAARLVFGAGWPLRAVGLDVTMRTLLRAPELDRLAAADTPVARFCTAVLAHYAGFYEKVLGERACAMHDPLAALLALEPDLATWEHLPVDVELRGELTRGDTVLDRRPDGAEEEPPDHSRPGVDVAVGVDSPAAVAKVLEGLLS